MRLSGPRAWLGVLPLVMAALGSCSEGSHEPLGLSPAFSVTGDFIPCPPNEYGLVKCTTATPDQLATMRGEAQRILDAATGQCKEAGQRILDGLNSGPIYMHHHSSDEGHFPEALTAFVESVGPPHPFSWLIVARYLVWPGHVTAGNLLNMLYHEGSHLLGYKDEDGGTYAFASSCVSQFHPKRVEDVTEPVGGGGGEDDCQCDDWQPTTCVVRKWFWVDTGEVIGYQLLYCY